MGSSWKRHDRHARAKAPGRRVLSGTSLAGGALLLLVACGREPPCPPAEHSGQPAAEPGELYVGTADPYEVGSLGVRTVDIPRCEAGAPRPMQVYAPQEAGTYPVLLFQHGFLIRNATYSEVLRHVASHGFVVVAPQMYAADGWPLGKPTTEEEAAGVVELAGWLAGNLSRAAGVTADVRFMGLAGHSRGGKVAWRVLMEGAARFTAVAGLDPTDGTLDGTGRVTREPLPAALPALIVATFCMNETNREMCRLLEAPFHGASPPKAGLRPAL